MSRKKHVGITLFYDEIKDSIWYYDGNKSSGPDRFNLIFFKKCWNFIKEDILEF